MAALAAIVAVGILVRWPGFTMGGFASHDVAGILYNAMLLADGGLPYVDDVELKAPGTFYLATLLAAPDGRNIAAFQVAAQLAGLGCTVGVAALAWRLWGVGPALLAAALYGLHDAHLDSMDANYVTWVQPFQVLAMHAALSARRGGTSTTSLRWWAAAGGAAGAAALCKRPAGMVFVAIVGWAMASREGGGRGQRAKAGLAISAGAVASHLPLVVHYGSAGELGALWNGYVLNRWGLDYVAMGAGHAHGWGHIWEGVGAAVHFLALPLALAVAAVARRLDRDAAWIGSWALAALVATTPGLRFYKGYFLTVLPPLCLLAAAPWGLLSARGRFRGAGWLLVAILAVRQGALLTTTRLHRFVPHDEGGRKITAFLRERGVTPGTPVWVWGWHLWDVYPMLGSRSASRIYKSLGLLTPPNDDTWRHGPSRARFVPGVPAQMLLADFERTPPAYIVLGSTVPHREFKELRQFLRRGYRRDRGLRIGQVEFWRHRDLPPAPDTSPP